MSEQWKEEYDDRKELEALVEASSDWQTVQVTVRLLRDLLEHYEPDEHA